MAKKILICDDDPDVRKHLGLLLRGAYEVVEARDGEEALRVIEAEAPDLVLLDIGMPKIDGLTSLKAYRKSHPNLTTIVLTGKREIGIARRALRLGAVEYVTKPFEAELIKAEIRRALESPKDRAKRDSAPPWRVAS